MENVETDRFGSFFKRVETERTALKIVNTAYPARKLHGLTEVAIKAWAEQDCVNSSRAQEEVTRILVTLAARIDALADQSRVVFSGETFDMLASHQLIIELQTAIAKLFHQEAGPVANIGLPFQH